MDCYFTLYHNTYADYLLFYKVYIKRENAGSWDSGLEKEQILKDYSVQLQKSWNSTEYLKINKEKSSPKMKARGPTPCSRGWGRAPWACHPTSWAPWWLSDVHLLPYEVFRWEKNTREPFGTRLRRHEAEPWRNQSRVVLPGTLPSGRGKSSPSSSPTLLSSEEGNLHQHLHQHHLISKP